MLIYKDKLRYFPCFICIRYVVQRSQLVIKCISRSKKGETLSPLRWTNIRHFV